ncbi:MAG TPA: hypothetical protein VNE82_12150 [Candidatus Binataceae bacterium]|nr:hypothetical protein [Candidatus Binataceae bacterium]
MNRFVAAIGQLHASADETPLPAIDEGGREPWPQIALWCLASIALVAIWLLGILSLDWLG